MKTNNIPQRLAAIRAFLSKHDIDAFIIPSTDPHMSEYPAEIWESRKWISGFTGSAGTAVVTKDKAGVWTDSRYFLQAGQQLKDTGFDLFKMGQPETPEMIDWIISRVGKGGTVGIDGLVYAAADAKHLEAKLSAKNITLTAEFDPFSEIWENRPEIPKNKLFILSDDIAGESAKSKIKRIVAELEKVDADCMIIATLDTIAWTFNIRGNDVSFNPVAVAYAIVSRDGATLFVDPDKLNEEDKRTLEAQGVTVDDYNAVFDHVARLSPDSAVCVTSSKINYRLYHTIPENCRIVDIPSPADLMKACKNETELAGFRNAMLKDAIALTKFYMWLEKAIPAGEVSELTIAEKLREYRSRQPLYVGESFGTIAGYAGNGAIVHYSASPESFAHVKPEGLLLIDSGAQFKDGTTDITRTLAVGKISKQMKKDYTLVLKGHIAIATAIFPIGTRGSQIDAFSRKALWDNCFTFWHGTGHGVGHFLNVHEGPQNIRLEENPTTLQPGMVTSNEPGVYRADEYGIRIENLIVTRPYKETEKFGAFYHFETITLCPIDTTPIIKKMLTKKEKKWLNNYHKMVYNIVSPHLSRDEKEWLKEKTKAI